MPLFAGLHSSGCSHGLCVFLAHSCRTFVGSDGDFTVRKPGEQTVVCEVQSRSEDRAHGELVAYSSSSSKPLDLHAVRGQCPGSNHSELRVGYRPILFLVLRVALALGATALCKHVQPHLIFEWHEVCTRQPRKRTFRPVLRHALE